MLVYLAGLVLVDGLTDDEEICLAGTMVSELISVSFFSTCLLGSHEQLRNLVFLSIYDEDTLFWMRVVIYDCVGKRQASLGLSQNKKYLMLII